jgi:hypothetical protein
MNSEMVRAATYIFAPYDTVWTAVTRPDQQGEWYVAPCLDFGWEPGERVAWGKLGKPVSEGVLPKCKEQEARLLIAVRALNVADCNQLKQTLS